MKKPFYHGLFAGLLAAFAANIYNAVYSKALEVDFSQIVNIFNITAWCLIVTVLASAGYYFFSKIVKNKSEVWFNIIFLLITFASFAIPFSISLPLNIKSPELFTGLVIPMHLFPVLFWIASKPLLDEKENRNSLNQ